jgi:hypothetical protein
LAGAEPEPAPTPPKPPVMSWSLKLGRDPGIDVYLHFTIRLLLVAS